MLVDLNAVLKDAKNNGYGVGLFNTTDTDMLEAVISAAEELRSPVIIGTAEVLLPYGELKLLAPSIVAAAKRATVPVVVHYDHGLTPEKTIEAMDLGFSSVMFDASTLPYGENVAATASIVKLAHSRGITVEGEIGHVGQADRSDDLAENGYTTVEEAVRFQADTGVDALAVSFGTAHGVYKSKPHLQLKRLAEISAGVDVPLVMHGGSGLSDDDFRNSIASGIAKVNIFTDLCVAGSRGCQEALRLGLGYLEMRNLKVAEIKKAVVEKIKLFGCAGKA